MTERGGALDATTLAGGDVTLAAALIARRAPVRGDASSISASVDFSTSNGPIDIVATVERFAAAGGAASAYAANVHRLDAIQGAVPDVHGATRRPGAFDQRRADHTGGLQAVEITVVWRVDNLVNIIIARGRYGGTRLDDALVLAGLQTQNESGGAPA